MCKEFLRGNERGTREQTQTLSVKVNLVTSAHNGCSIFKRSSYVLPVCDINSKVQDANSKVQDINSKVQDVNNTVHDVNNTVNNTVQVDDTRVVYCLITLVMCKHDGLQCTTTLFAVCNHWYGHQRQQEAWLVAYQKLLLLQNVNKFTF